MPYEIVTTSDRPDLLPVTARWRWEAFFRDSGRSYESVLEAACQTAATPRTMPRTWVLLADGEPVGTASLVAQDLEERPDLTPWLAGVVVAPLARGQGCAARLVAAVEQAASAASFSTLWLYTNKAERIYARLGWQTAEIVQHNGKPFAVMRRDLTV